MKKTAALCALTFMLSYGVDADTVKMASETYVNQNVSDVSNYVDRAISTYASTNGMVTSQSLTNDVSAIVTNRIPSGYTDWKFIYNGEPSTEFSLVNSGGNDYILYWNSTVYGTAIIEDNVTEVQFGPDSAWDGGNNSLICTRELTYSNSLGLMQEDDLKRTIAMFIIPVNTDGSGSRYVGFELKASTNNFSHATGENARLQFYAQSEVADKDASFGNIWDKMKMYVGTGYGSSWDVRAYTKIPNTIYWDYELRNVVVLVDASCIVKHPDGDWLREDNEDLMWCYLRNTNGDGGEKEGETTRNLWHPIAPVRWFKKLPNWAKQ